MSKLPNELTKEIELDFDFCENTYSVSPCTAALGGTGDAKCFNTRATCQDPDNYNPGTRTLQFVRSESFAGAGKIPSLISVQIDPAKLSGGTGRDTPLGERGKMTVQVKDHPSNDHQTDKYFDERENGTAGNPSYKPIEVGTFWGKFRARNRYYIGRSLRAIMGIGGDIRTRKFVIEEMRGFSGTPTIVGKDPLKLADDERSQCPKQSRGVLASNISDTDTGFSLKPAGIGDEEYPESGTASIGKELVEFTRSGDSITLTARSVNGVADSHDEDDTFQLAKVIDGASVDDIVEDLLVNFSPVTADLIPKSDWASEVDQYIPNVYTTTIPKPTGVKKLIGELSEQAGFSVAWDDLKQEILLVAVKQPDSSAIVFDDDLIVAGSFDAKDNPRKRISQIWTAFGIIDPVSNIEESSNYRSHAVNIDSDAEHGNEYGQPRILKIFSRWIPQFGLSVAQDLNTRLLSRFRDIPRDIRFSVPRFLIDDIALGQTRTVKSRYMQDRFGQIKSVLVRILSIVEDEDVLNIGAEEQLFIQPPDVDRNIIISNDTLNFNLREAHDQIFTPPSSGDTVICTVQGGVVVGGSSPGIVAFNVGDWPEGVEILIILESGAYIVGKGGSGGDAKFTSTEEYADDGEYGGKGFYTRYDVTIENNGVIGGGGGGGGGASGIARASTTVFYTGASGGGGGAGRDIGDGGNATVTGQDGRVYEDNGEDGTLVAGGDGGTIIQSGSGYSLELIAGDGGDLGQNGGDGSATASGAVEASDYDGVGGSAGDAIDGVSYITFNPQGQILGPQVN